MKRTEQTSANLAKRHTKLDGYWVYGLTQDTSKSLCWLNKKGGMMILGKRSRLVGLGVVVASLLIFSAKATSQQESANLISNPGFEEVCEKGGISLPKSWVDPTRQKWYEKPKGSGISDVVIDDQVSHSGKCSLKITGTNNRVISWQCIYRSIVENAGYSFSGKYRVSGWIKTYNMGAVDVVLKISYWTRKSKEEKWKWIRCDTIGNLQGTNDWTKVSKIITTPSDSAFDEHFEISVSTLEPNTGLVWFDDISLTKEK